MSLPLPPAGYTEGMSITDPSNGFHTGEYDFPSPDEFVCEIWNRRGSLVCYAKRQGKDWTFVDPFTKETDFIHADVFRKLATQLEAESLSRANLLYSKD